MLQKIQEMLYNNEIEFMDPFAFYGIQTRYMIMTNFCTDLCQQLLKRQHDHKKQIKEYRPLFSTTWLIMFINYIDLRKKSDISALNAAYKNGKIESREEYENGCGKLFRNMLYFCREAKVFQGGTLLVLQ